MGVEPAVQLGPPDAEVSVRELDAPRRTALGPPLVNVERAIRSSAHSSATVSRSADLVTLPPPRLPNGH
jgi:hypothetical protein